MTVSFLQLLVY